ncbi:hypothetical protein ACLE20_06995 [Rhizobium sp. YIM 134829]|uniref:hypothetical protein n=1 Tax=Rhizobium sp. YIM 134829 TaxID=3390453 RepID=UPI0039798260
MDLVGPFLFPDDWKPEDTVDLRYIRPEEEEQLIASRKRFKEVQEFIGTAIGRSGLRYGLRPLEGGRVIPAREFSGAQSPYAGEPYALFGPELWMLDDYSSAFQKCMMEATFVLNGTHREDMLIYVEKAGLSQLIAKQDDISQPPPPAHATVAAEVYLSPFLKFMLDFVASQGNDAGEQSRRVNSENKAALELVLVSEWEKRFPELPKLGKTKSEYMATFLREVESQLGRNR